MKITSLLLAAISAIALCTANASRPSWREHFDWVTPQGPVITQEFDLGAFDSINVSCITDVTFRQSDVHRVVVRARENMMGYVNISVRNNSLVFNSVINDTNTRIDTRHLDDNEPTFELIVYAPSLLSATFSGMTRAIDWDTISGDMFRLVVSGMLNAEIDFDVQVLLVDGSGMADLSLLGTTHVLNANVSGMVNLDSSSLAAAEVDVIASGMANAIVYASSSLRIGASGMASVFYLGSAPHISYSETGMATIRPRR